MYVEEHRWRQLQISNTVTLKIQLYGFLLRSECPEHGKSGVRSGATQEHVGTDYGTTESATVQVQDLASTYMLRPRPRTGCPDFGVMISERKSVTECDGTEL